MSEFRPQEIEHLFGQNHLHPVLAGWKANHELIPHAIMFSGPYGCGKTSIARMLASWITTGAMNITELNAAEARGIDEVRAIGETVKYNPLGGGAKVYIFDEVHQMTKDAQSALLKLLEDVPKRTYFFLCTTEKQKVLPPVSSRCSPIEVKILNKETTSTYANWLGQWWYQKAFSQDVLETIYQRTEGHARDVVNLVKLLGQGGNFEKLPDGGLAWGAGQSLETFKMILKGPSNYHLIGSLLANVEPYISMLDGTIDSLILSEQKYLAKYTGILQLRSNRKLYLISPQEYVLGVISTLCT